MSLSISWNGQDFFIDAGEVALLDSQTHQQGGGALGYSIIPVTHPVLTKRLFDQAYRSFDPVFGADLLSKC
jgi:hypothetical protein